MTAPTLAHYLERVTPMTPRKSARRSGETAANGVGAVVSLPLTILGAPIRIIAGQ